MTVSTYAELKVAIAEWTTRSDSQSQLDTFIDMAEVAIADQLRVREMEYRTTLSTSTSTRFVSLPSDYIKMRQLMITIDDQLYDMEMVPLKDMWIADSAGVPSVFTITSQIELNCVSDQVYTLEIDYYRKITALSDANPTNDILTNYPMVYLSACLHFAFQRAWLEDKAEYWRQQFITHVSAANRRGRNGRYGPAPAMRVSKGMIV